MVIQRLSDLIQSSIYNIYIIVVINLLIAIYSYYTKKLTLLGSLSALIMGIMIFYSLSLKGYIMMLFFFLASNLITKVLKSKESNRNIMQVIANAIIPLIYAILYYLFEREEFIIYYSVSLSFATSDTFSSESGVLSKTDPISLLTFKRVPKGFNGAVSLIGSFSGLVGSILISLLYYLYFNQDIKIFLIIIISSFAANIIDSLLGARLQNLYREEDGSYQDYKTETNVKIRGFLNNDGVNLISSASSILFCCSLLKIF